MSELSGVTILPTGRCFDDALDFIEHRLKRQPGLARLDVLHLVHGICLIPEDQPEAGEPFAHAWVEELEDGQLIAWQGGLLEGERVYYAMCAADFVRELRVVMSTRYSLREASDENRRSSTYGPWREEYLALCKDKRKRSACQHGRLSMNRCTDCGAELFPMRLPGEAT